MKGPAILGFCFPGRDEIDLWGYTYSDGQGMSGTEFFQLHRLVTDGSPIANGIKENCESYFQL